VIGIVQREWKKVKRLALAGAMGFSFYFLITFFSNFVYILLPILSEKYMFSDNMLRVVPKLIDLSIQLIRGFSIGFVSGVLLNYELTKEFEGPLRDVAK
jgi:hypothetical protein